VPGYEILEELGRGAMGVVYKARQLALNRLVALKMVIAGSHASPEQRERFQAEAQGLARLAHPHIVQIYEVGEAGGQPYFSLELVEGGNLDRKLTGTPMAARQAAALVETLARAVHHAHQKGVLHRDLKPANVLLTLDGTPKIADFGLVKFVAGEAGQAVARTAGTRSGAIIGTPSYMAPEQAGAKGHSVGPAADVWALGAILYECLTGRPPFRAETPLDIIRQVLHEEPVPPARLQPGLPRDLDTICLKCLQKDPRKRYAGGDALADDLRRFLDGLPIRARPVGPAGRLTRWCRRNPVVASLVAAVALLLVAASVVSTAFAWRLNALREEAERVAQKEAAARADAEESARQAREASENEAVARRDAQAERARAETERGRAEQIVYHNGMARAAGSWLANDTALAERRLDECLPQLRRWEWHYLKRLCHAELETKPGPPCEPGRSVAVSGDGGRWAVVRKQGFGRLRINARAVGIWDARTGRELSELDPDAEGPLAALALRPDGQRLALARAGGAVQVWDPDTAEVLRSIDVPQGCLALAYSPNGRRLAGACGDGQVRVWDGQTGKEQFTVRGAAGKLLDVAFRPDGRQFAAAAGDGTIKVCNTPIILPLSGEQGVTEVHTLAGKRGNVSFLTYSPDGGRLAAAYQDGTVRVWNVASGKELFTGAAGTAVNYLAFSSDGRRLALACEDRTVRVWQGHSGRELFALRGHADGVALVGFQTDGARLVSLGRDGNIKAWDPVSGGLALHLGVGSPHHAFSPDGRLVAVAVVGNDGALTVWDTATGKEAFTLRGHKGAVWKSAFSPDGQHLTVASVLESQGKPATREFKVWNLATRESTTLKSDEESGGEAPWVTFSPGGAKAAVVRTKGAIVVLDGGTGKGLCTLPQSGLQEGVQALAFSAGGKWLAVAGATRLQEIGLANSTLQVHDAATGRLVGLCQAAPPHGHSGAVRGLAFGSPGPGTEVETLATAGEEDRSVKLWNIRQTGPRVAAGYWVVRQPVFTLRGHTQPVWCVSFSADGKRLASVSSNSDQTAGEVKLWDVASGQELLSLRHAGREVSFSPDGRWLAVGSTDGVTLYDGSPSRESLVCREAGTAATYRPDGVRLVSWGAGDAVKLWDAGTGRPGGVLKGQSDGYAEGHAARVRHAAFSHEGTRLAAGDEDGLVKVWDPDTARVLRTLKGHTDAVVWVAFSPDGRRLATASSDETVKIWDVNSGSELRTFKEHTDRVQCVAFSPDGRLLASAGEDGTVRLWDGETGQESRRLDGHENFVNVVAFSPDGTRLASAGEDSTVRLWDTAAGKEVRKLLGHQGGVRGVAFSPDGQRLATAGWEGRIKVWDATSGKQLLDFDGRGGGLVAISFSPDGRRLAAAGSDETLRVWDVAP
jgi:WD40 repeat protein/tRNA A-37 threonylcarbamoyl transferase component Bud32